MSSSVDPPQLDWEEVGCLPRRRTAPAASRFPPRCAATCVRAVCVRAHHCAFAGIVERPQGWLQRRRLKCSPSQQPPPKPGHVAEPSHQLLFERQQPRLASQNNGRDGPPSLFRCAHFPTQRQAATDTVGRSSGSPAVAAKSSAQGNAVPTMRCRPHAAHSSAAAGMEGSVWRWLGHSWHAQEDERQRHSEPVNGCVQAQPRLVGSPKCRRCAEARAGGAAGGLGRHVIFCAFGQDPSG